MSKYPEYQHTKSRAWFDRALHVIPSGVYGHLGPSEGLFLPLEKWPLLSSKAKGAYFWDMDGNPYLDLMCAYGPNVLGYGDPDVDRAAVEQLMTGNCTTAPSYKMVECAELLVDTVAMADWAFFMKNGTDATTFSILTARAFTGKKKTMFLRGYYHGNDPWAMKADYPGVLPEDVANNLVVPWFDLPAMEAAYEACGGDVAALIAQPYDHGNFADNRCATKEFWASVRQFWRQAGHRPHHRRRAHRLPAGPSGLGPLLRIPGRPHLLLQGPGQRLQHVRRLRPGASEGHRLLHLLHRLLLDERRAFAACIACIQKLKALDAPALFRRMGLQLTQGFQAAAKAHGFDLVISGEPALFYLRIANDDSLMLHQEWVAECVSRGLFLASHHNHFLNAAITDEDIALAIDIANDAFSVVAARHPELELKK